MPAWKIAALTLLPAHSDGARYDPEEQRQQAAEQVQALVENKQPGELMLHSDFRPASSMTASGPGAARRPGDHPQPAPLGRAELSGPLSRLKWG